MQIVSEIAEIVASAIDCVLVLWFLTSHFGKKKTIEWWKYAVWFVILFIPSHFMGEIFNLQSIVVILIVTSFSMIYLQGNSIEKLIVPLILYIMLAFVNIMVIQVISVLSKSPMEVLISGNGILRILVLCISKVTVILTFVIAERTFSKKHYFKKEEYIFGAILYITFFIVAVLTFKIVGTVEMTFREQLIFFILTMPVSYTHLDVYKRQTIHWVPAPFAKKCEVRLYENLVDEEKGVYNKEDGSLNLNPDSLKVLKDCYVEPELAKAEPYDSFQFVRQGYFCADARDSTPEHPVFNRIVSLKSSFKLPAQS